MPDSMDIDPDVLRELAEQHYRVADDTEAWAEPPQSWLDSFIDSYGTIAAPVKRALDDYYNARKNAGYALAGQHRKTGDSLRAAADEFERVDNESARQLGRAGEENGSGPQLQTPTQHQPPAVGPGDSSTAPPPSGVGTPVGDTPAGAVPPGATQAGAPNGAAPGVDGATPSDTAAAGEDSQGPGVGAAQAGGVNGAAVPTGSAVPGGSAVTAPGGVPPTVSAGSGGPGGPGSGPADDRSAQPPTGATGRTDLPPMPIPTPFAAAVSAAKEKEAEPAYMVGDAVDNDLLLARTLLSAVLAAVDSSVLGLNWAVAVMRGPAGAGVFITSNEGRGWLPAELFLPREVSTPWVWDEFLADGSGDAGSPWEGVADPARVLVEFGLSWGAKANARLSALVSSGAIDSGLRTRFSDVPMEGLVGAAYDVDLRVFTPDTADRLGLVGSVESLEHVSAVPDSQVRERCVELAADAHAKVGRTSAATPDAAGSRGVRERILASVQAGRDIPASWWDELRDADDLLAAAMLSQRVDVGRVEPGDLRVDEESAGLRAMVFERRCNELVMLLGEESTRQQLRDAVYAHDQIVKHPRFEEIPAAVSVAEDSRVSRPAVSAGAVSAPEVTGGPPPNAVAAPQTPPTIVAPDTIERS
ncbi:type VII secretion target [Nocardia mexicana]|uniref:Excreted virulence factor EspC (Type VII ESX diderm) n=1 Tax=Nocardia mexicana TaxID=279262 RepID=A0A370HCN6_9NOCA|nr:type VII secretion target [Nocardia mexicana]RDI54550.1 excreted virulence factor EspC (type VII ESX diderm) [Nocardia mexicana]